jgi:hypothetical protein
MRIALLLIVLSTLVVTAAGCSQACPEVVCREPPSVTLRLVDASGAPVAVPQSDTASIFTVGGKPAPALCDDAVDGAVVETCSVVHFYAQYGVTIHVAVPGYAPTDVVTDVTNDGTRCCDHPENPLDTTVRLTPN